MKLVEGNVTWEVCHAVDLDAVTPDASRKAKALCGKEVSIGFMPWDTKAARWYYSVENRWLVMHRCKRCLKLTP
jgi:hypothetical protein